MSFNLELGLRDEELPAHEGLGRPRRGWEQYCGQWVLVPPADLGRRATFNADGKVVMVAELRDVTHVSIKSPGTVKIVLAGRVVAADDVSEDEAGEAVGVGPSPDITSIASTPTRRVCACGCGTRVPRSALFAPGHDKKAIHERIGRRWGSLVEFIRWFDATEGAEVQPAQQA